MLFQSSEKWACGLGQGSLPSAWEDTWLAILQREKITAEDGLVSARQVRHYTALKIKHWSLHWIFIKAFAELRGRYCSGCNGWRSAHGAVTWCCDLDSFWTKSLTNELHGTQWWIKPYWLWGQDPWCLTVGTALGKAVRSIPKLQLRSHTGYSQDFQQEVVMALSSLHNSGPRAVVIRTCILEDSEGKTQIHLPLFV